MPAWPERVAELVGFRERTGRLGRLRNVAVSSSDISGYSKRGGTASRARCRIGLPSLAPSQGTRAGGELQCHCGVETSYYHVAAISLFLRHSATSHFTTAIPAHFDHSPCPAKILPLIQMRLCHVCESLLDDSSRVSNCCRTEEVRQVADLCQM